MVGGQRQARVIPKANSLMKTIKSAENISIYQLWNTTPYSDSTKQTTSAHAATLISREFYLVRCTCTWMCMCCVFVCVHGCMYVHVWNCVCVFTCASVCGVCVCMYRSVCVYVCLHVCMCRCVYVCLCMCACGVCVCLCVCVQEHKWHMHVEAGGQLSESFFFLPWWVLGIKLRFQGWHLNPMSHHAGSQENVSRWEIR